MLTALDGAKARLHDSLRTKGRDPGNIPAA
jgi:hypothetical protein